MFAFQAGPSLLRSSAHAKGVMFKRELVKFVTIIMLLAMTPSFGLACVFPYQGEEYDALIEIEKVKSTEVVDEITYILKFPVNVNNNDVTRANIYLYKDENVKVVQKATDELEEIIEIDEYVKIPLFYKKQGDVIVGTFSTSEINDFNIRISVEWYSRGCCLCATYGYRTIKHNQKLQNIQAKKTPEVLN